MGIQLHYMQVGHIIIRKQQGVGDTVVASDIKRQSHALTQGVRRRCDACKRLLVVQRRDVHIARIHDLHAFEPPAVAGMVVPFGREGVAQARLPNCLRREAGTGAIANGDIERHAQEPHIRPPRLF